MGKACSGSPIREYKENTMKKALLTGIAVLLLAPMCGAAVL